MKGRTALRQYFEKNTPIELSRCHPTIAFSEEQIHTVLRTISIETEISSFHMMKFLLLQAVQGKVTAKNHGSSS